MVPLGTKLNVKSDTVHHFCFCNCFNYRSHSAKLLCLRVASLLIEITSIVPQLILPLASLSAPEEQGKVVGTIMSGLLVGILLSRTLSGFIGDTLGWRCYVLPQDYVSYYFLSSETISL
jgi:predicted MFS family arabinose efflux permease